MQSGILPVGTLFYRVFHDSPVGMVITTVAEGRYVEVNDAFLRLMGQTWEELAGQTFTMVGLHNQEERDLVLNVLKRVDKLGNIPLILTPRNGEPRPCIASVQGEEIEGQVYFIIIIQDLAEQEAAQVALQISETRFRLLFQGIPLPLLVVDDATRNVLDVNAAACQLYGYTAGEFTGLTLTDLIPPADRVGHAGTPIDTAAIRRQRLKDGAIIDVDVSSHSFDLDGRRVSLAIIQDVTEERAAQAALRTSEERLRIVADISNDAIWNRDMSTDDVEWSAGLNSLFGYGGDDVERPHNWWINHIHPDDRLPIEESIEAAMDTGERYWAAEYRFLRADGAYGNVLDRGFIIRDADGQPIRFIGAMVDITQQLQVAEAASRAAAEERQRLAHDLHTSVTQTLYSLSLLAEAARRRSSAGEYEVTTEFIGRLGELSGQALRQLRLLLYELRPAVLEQEGLAGALRHRLEAVEKRAGINASLIDELDSSLPLALQSELFAIGQEALNFALKHAAATAITVYLRDSDGAVVLEATDNGAGYTATMAHTADDLLPLRRRVVQIGGALEVIAEPGQDQTLRATVPIVAPEDDGR